MTTSSFIGLLLNLPDVQLFWRHHRRIRKLPEQEIEVEGQRALRTTFASVTNAAQIAIISRCTTLDVLAIHGDRAAAPGR